jgi:CBS domain-containing protein
MPVDAASIMTRRVLTAKVDDTVAEIAKRLLQRGISALPVCDEGGALVGIISEGDLLRPFGRDHQLRGSWWLGLLANGSPLIQELVEYVRSDQRRACDVMTSPVISVTEDTSVCDVARLLIQHHIKRVPVARNNMVVGIVSRADVVCVLAQQPHALDDKWQPAHAGGNLPLCD